MLSNAAGAGFPEASLQRPGLAEHPAVKSETRRAANNRRSEYIAGG